MLKIKPKGGTEMMVERLKSSISKSYFDRIQLIVSKIDESTFDTNKKKVLWIHDTVAEPNYSILFNKTNFIDSIDAFVFVSHWQMSQFINHFKMLPINKCHVIKNAIEPINISDRTYYSDYEDSKVKLVYTSTPHRGLLLFYEVFNKIVDEFTHLKIEADIFSSFEIYGWEDAQKAWQPFFDKLAIHPNINYYGTVSNDEVRKALVKSDIFFYPCIYPETYCLSMVEAMSAGCIVVAPYYSALPEIGGNYVEFYPFSSDTNKHMELAYEYLSDTISKLEYGYYSEKHLKEQKHYIDSYNDWKFRAYKWVNLFDKLLRK